MKEKDKFIFHIIDQELWQEIEQDKYYSPDSLQNEGFIHFSFQYQVSSVERRFYSNIENLFVLKVEVQKLEFPLLIEKSGNDGEFPHLYGKLNLDSVNEVYFLRKCIADNLLWNGKIIKRFPI